MNFLNFIIQVAISATPFAPIETTPKGESK